MITYLIAAIFVINVAITSASILLLSQLRTQYKTNFLSSLLLYQVFFFSFGFYSFWGQVIVTSFLSNLVSAELLGRIKDITLLLGLPFLLFATLMYIRFSREISGLKVSNVFILVYVIANILIILLLGLLLKNKPEIHTLTFVKYYFILFSTATTLLGVFYLLTSSSGKSFLSKRDKKRMSFKIIFLLIAQNSMLLFYEENIILGLLFIFTYYLHGGFLPLYFKYKAKLITTDLSVEPDLSFEQFCEKFGVSKRESEIITEICLGLTNQQIADKLFISLQTVKDHTHRIYNKTGCENRSQLIRYVNDFS